MPQLGPYSLPNPYILAPMAGVSEMPFRVIAFRLGAALCPTELVSSQGLMRANQRTLKYLRYDAEVERPYSLQIYGGEPEAMARAAVVGREAGAQIIDINMGCPVKKVTKNGAGSALLCDPPRAARIVREIREATGLPVTCKIRSGWDVKSRNYLQMAAALQEAGCAALAIHPRTREQGYSGQADWSVIADLKRHFPDMPIIGNGDVKTPEDARRMRETTGCDFVMIGRAALGNPWIFRELLGGPPATPQERCALVLEHLRAHLDFVGDALGAVRSFRKQLAWYAHGLFGAAAFRAEVNALDAPGAVEDCVRRFFAAADTDAAGTSEEQDVDYRAALG
ncbi:tRNA dihydrouridine synthase DusB [Pyxidicoccus fallax]|uniref:tRNA-dihydrouridine synthase n=1 Tax=Pyxidicoccus fallax TaxID=394095 RepID=A0A848LBT6_9BACT|nr:tRNA dihydrouridine synthase DusB [Pyxidicoccus fallax]NMO15954.1 tRNA dihydrouridine synthase DusB [Pyxidicoccus fallax]NPC82561.1 tRNA dihydrouridine synthase DusB [Pyxidicoccus fallax]